MAGRDSALTRDTDDDLRHFAQLDRADVVEFDLNRALEQGLRMSAGLLDRLRIVAERQFEPLPVIEGSAAHLNQALFNLLLNAAQAIEATGRGSGTIRVSTRAEADVVVAEIADDGCGIVAEALPRIFDPFFTTKPVGRGTGMGLSLAHRIVSEHAGSIDCDASGASGTTFRVRLPTLRPGCRREATGQAGGARSEDETIEGGEWEASAFPHIAHLLCPHLPNTMYLGVRC